MLLGSLVGPGWAVGPSVAAEFRDLDTQVEEGYEEVRDWLTEGPLGLSEGQIDRAIEGARETLSSGAGGGGGTGLVLDSATLLAEVLAGAAVALVVAFFVVKDGHRFAGWAAERIRPERRVLAQRTGTRAWHVLGGFLRGSAVVGLVDGVVIGVGVAILGVPLALPIAILTFFGAFFPIVGATVAALVALVANGPVDALIVVGIVIVVQQLEGDLISPLVVGKAIRLHPAVVILVLTAGAALAGILGAFLAVPTAGVVAAVLDELRQAERRSPSSATEVAAPGPEVEPAAREADGPPGG